MATHVTALADLILARCRQQPEKSAIICADGRLITYGDLGDQVQALKGTILGMSMADDILGIQLDDEVNAFRHYLAAMAAGRAVDLGPGTSGCSLLATNQGIRPAETPFQSAVDLTTINVIVRTSGTSGEPKRTVHTTRGLLAAIWNTGSVVDEILGAGVPPVMPESTAEMVGTLLERPPLGLTYLVALNVRSIGALSVMNRTLATGDTILLPRSMAARDIVQACAMGIPVSNLGLAPFSAQQTLRIWQRGDAPAPVGVLSCGLGGAGVLPRTCEQLESLLLAPVTSAYGSTELGGVALMGRPWDPPEVRWHSVGRPLPGITAAIRGDGVSGELVVSSPAAMVGTLSHRNEFLEANQPLATGDLAARGAQGEYRIQGRADYVILRAGRRIDPVRVEQALEADPRVRRAGVVGRPSRVGAESDVIAIVELHSGSTRHGLRGLCVDLLNPHEVPRKIVIVSSIPTTRDGKLDRSALPSLLR